MKILSSTINPQNSTLIALLVFEKIRFRLFFGPHCKTINHKNLVTLLDAFTPNGKNVYFVYEYMDYSMRALFHSSLSDPKHIKNMVWDQNNGDYFTADILFQLFCGLRYLHQDRLKFIHRDIKPENILLKELPTGRFLLKICDLGLSRHLKEDEKDVTEYVVTWPYRAPEVMINDSYSFPIDIWSVGCILAEMITGDILFKRLSRRNQIFRILSLVGFPEGTVFPEFFQSEINKIPGSYGPNRIHELFTDDQLPTWTQQRITKQFIRDLLKNLLEFDPSMRLTAEQLSELSQLDFLEDRSGINDIAPMFYNPVNESKSHTVSEWRQLIKKELNDYEIKRFQNPNVC